MVIKTKLDENTLMVVQEQRRIISKEELTKRKEQLQEQLDEINTSLELLK